VGFERKEGADRRKYYGHHHARALSKVTRRGSKSKWEQYADEVGKVEKGKITEYRVTLEVTFILE
jgi:flavin-binding protein dodecin